MNTKYFIVNNVFTFGIFLNTPSGIVRYIPNEFTSQFFNIIFNNMKIDLDPSFKFWNGYARSTNTTVTDTMPMTLITKSITPLITDGKFIE